MKIGILGGTFNPIHIGHLILGDEARRILNLDKLIFVPAYLPPHKEEEDLIDAEDRYKMVALAIKENPFFEVSKSEINRRDKSYSIQTIREFKDRFGEKAELFLITGSDVLEEISMWREIDKIFKLSNFIVANRPGYPTKEIPPEVRLISIIAINLSSSGIRERIREGKSIRYLVPERVRQYIIKKKLYTI